ncbi:hypothetical protein VFPFJ_09872 [Purpureocillium lilacinum]|uniref:Uncharacterized protein n=1 Tax=Purpureocillium lilacinum TaxID=33203 RepID=A0A179GNA1_PURLI|nr:hypothetical protein VFPFJ_09872 [Purpureocillium lilacinum]OAQ76299.1 hypothetical protein VFPBJ_08659 [Purpureocillium lilacinum]OAQ79386.1 hypothetical protein VFPFJ_09872 [Purpureocillium lilacinum]
MALLRQPAIRLARTGARPAQIIAARRYSSEPPRSQARPAAPKEIKIALVGAVGVGIGACYFFLMGRPDQAADAASKNLESTSGPKLSNK